MEPEDLTLVKRDDYGTLLVDMSVEPWVFYEQQTLNGRANQISVKDAKNAFEFLSLSTEHAQVVKDKMGW